jgi:tRNA/tmRNA/rRNA uracil-C5-methylase (TrmA/RlmC/RlmD family)
LRCDLSKHYLSEEHQKILLLHLSQLASTTIDANQKLLSFDKHADLEINDLPSKETTAASTTLVTDECPIQQENINETMNMLCGGIETLNDNIQRLSNESLQQSLLVQTNGQNLAVLKTSLAETNIAINTHSVNMAVLQQECLSLKQKIEERQSTSYDGTLIWKISNIQAKMSKILIFCIYSVIYF